MTAQRKLEDEYNALLKAHIQQGLNYRELEIERDTLREKFKTFEEYDCDELKAAYAIMDNLRTKLAEVEKDAELWRKYKSRKDAVIAAGMGKNPLRQEVQPDTYACINKDGEVEYSAPWSEACHDHIKEMQDACGLGHVVGWKVRGIKILAAMKEQP